MSPGNFIGYLVALAVIGLGVVIATQHGLEHASSGWRYVDLITILLTTLAVIITALGIGIAILGVWGYTQIKENTMSVARSTVPGHVKTELKQHVDSDEFRDLVKSELERMYREDAADRTLAVTGDEGDADQPNEGTEFPSVPRP